MNAPHACAGQKFHGMDGAWCSRAKNGFSVRLQINDGGVGVWGLPFATEFFVVSRRDTVMVECGLVYLPSEIMANRPVVGHRPLAYV